MKKSEFEPQGKRDRVLGTKRGKKKKKTRKISPAYGKLSIKKIEKVVDKAQKKNKKKISKIIDNVEKKDTNKTYISDKQIIEALMERGTIAGASRVLNCSYRTIQQRVKSGSDISRVLEAKEKSCLSILYGYAIDNILSLLIEGDFNASKLVLEKKCGWVGAIANVSHDEVLSDNEIKNKIENMTQEEREKRILELQEKLMSKKMINVTPTKKG